MDEANADDDEGWWGAIRGWENNDHGDGDWPTTTTTISSSLDWHTDSPQSTHALPKLVSSSPTKRAVGRLANDAQSNNSNRLRKTAAQIHNGANDSVSIATSSLQPDNLPNAASSHRTNASPHPIAKNNNNGHGGEKQQSFKEYLLEISLRRNRVPAVVTLTTTPTTKTTSVAENNGGKSVPKPSSVNAAPKASGSKPALLHLASPKNNKAARQKITLEARKLEPMHCKVVALIEDKQTWRPVPDPKQLQ